MDKNKTSQMRATLKEIREDLKDIRRYYLRKEHFDKSFKITDGENCIMETVRKYNEAVRTVKPAILYDLYASLYTQNFTQEGLAHEWGFATIYIQKLNEKLVQYFYHKFDEGGIK